MRSTARYKKSIYLAVLALLPLMLAGGAQGQALAGTPVAKYIGADAYHNPAWSPVDNPSSKYYLDPQSEKFFYLYNATEKGLPSSDADPTSAFNIPGCGATSRTGYVYPTSTLCIIVWNYAASKDGSDLQSFLESTLSDPHQIVMAFCNEPEFHVTSTGCYCDLTGTPKACGGAYNFRQQFAAESAYIMNFEKTNKATNVHVAEISGVRHYTAAHPSCFFIVPPQEVDYYLADVYEPDHKSDANLGANPDWNRWMTCTSFPGSGVDRGISEYGIDCGNEHWRQGHVAGTFAADDTYLRNNMPDMLVWNIWDVGRCAINATDEPQSVAAWLNIAAGN